MTVDQDVFPIRLPRDIGILGFQQRVVTASSAWIEHIPFAFWIVGAAEPRVLVELGTHWGHSYFAFAQAVQEQELPTSMYAVDTWEGDEHSGFYGEEVFASVAEHNDRAFAGFSTLLRTTFDEALEHFEDGEVDLLHIDGHHTYESVSHDFESWRPKLSARGVVILHDVAVRERDFGVHRAWAELADRYSTFVFDHGHGLGVAGIGSDVPEPVDALLELDPKSPAAVAVRRLFATLGRRVALEADPADTVRVEKEAEIDDLRVEHADTLAAVRAEAAAAIETVRVEKEAEIDDLRVKHADTVAELQAKADREVAAARVEIDLANARAASAYDERLRAIMREGS